MKKVFALMLASVLVLGFGLVTTAAQLDQKDFEVNLSLSKYAELTVPGEALSFGEVDVASVVSGTGASTKDAGVELRTNTDVRIELRSFGFQDENNVLNKFVEYYSNEVSFNAGGWHSRSFGWTGTVIPVPFKGVFRTTRVYSSPGDPFGNWFYQIQAGNYSDTVILTVSAN